MLLRLFTFLLVALQGSLATSRIDRRQVVRSFNPHRNASSRTTPLQVGNGNFAFGVDVTGLQTFSPFATMSTWGWHNFSLPTTVGQTSVDDFTGLDWWTHGRLVNYNQPNPAQNDISNWLIRNPQRVNLGTIGLWFGGDVITEEALENKSQTLDLWTGKISSSFTYKGAPVKVETWADSNSDTIGIAIESELFSENSLGIFFDFPLPTTNKFDAPFVGVFNATEKHNTTLQQGRNRADIRHDMDATSYYTSFTWDTSAKISGPLNGTHRYILQPSNGCKRIEISVAFSPALSTHIKPFSDLKSSSKTWWESFWESGAFIDLSGVKSPNATELQRRTILSQYLIAVNSASSYPPQESGLVNNGWYGKFHLEMVLWHLLQFARWNQFPLLRRSLPNMYNQYLDSSIDRANLQGYDGARWGKMTDPTGRSAPGEINSLLIWQQPHPMYFAELEYRSSPNNNTLESWDSVLTSTADFMASYVFFNESTKHYDLGPPMYPASENTNPNATINPAFELAYWRFGLDIAIKWKQRQNLAVSDKWVEVRDNLAPLPIADDVFAVYEGIPNMWQNTTVQDHPAMSAIFGLLPPPSSGPSLNMTVVKNTADKIRDLWDLEDCWGWDFPMLAMNSLRIGDIDQAVAYLLHPLFDFDDAGYPVGGSRVPTPYMPGSGAFLLAMAMMAGGWDGEPEMHFPEGWNVRTEGFLPGL
ncbi:Six-hairpin glycosidase-like protein [Annulohypoxylon maeteangense]|uniref:Six-hairpin glycosidase-like protein n=1 Tax=Annulohypoxylon maeteangense TaxID=1927788 RepID=UPI0020075E30|nr:Six-hairpin glycosidase-like protein [Annulohypoxylon maeteangense]KAI0882533.1 Six-hairpin glycosidase-like protein [Annulohypoxylon maeteangense]